MIGVMARFPAPQLPIAMRQIMIVLRIQEVQPGEAFRVAVSMVTPAGTLLTPQDSAGFEVTVVPDYIVITLRDIPLREEGVHRFSVSVGKGNPVSIDVPVRIVGNREPADGNAHDGENHAFQQTLGISGRPVN